MRVQAIRQDFNPRPPCGRRLHHIWNAVICILFQPTSPVRETTSSCGKLSGPMIFQPTSPVRETTRSAPPSGGEDVFQPTSPVRETTTEVKDGLLLIGISTHVPRAGDDCGLDGAVPEPLISTHVPRAGDDLNGRKSKTIRWNFNPRPPCGRRLPCFFRVPERFPISTHVPRAGDDGPAGHSPCIQADFNPRPPCGRRHWAGLWGFDGSDFNPRPPCGRRPGNKRHIWASFWYFNPRPPCGRRP